MALMRRSIARDRCKKWCQGRNMRDSSHIYFVPDTISCRGTQRARRGSMELVHDIRAILRRARSGEPGLDAAAAERLWGAILDDALDAVEVGAILGALSALGETFEELVGLQGA